MSSRPKILVYYGVLHTNGGANGVAAWILQALREDFEVTLLTWKPIDVAKLNSTFGTSLRNDDFQVRTVAYPTRKLIELDPDDGSIQKYAWLMRASKRIGHMYDLVVSADNEGDFGAPALQYVHTPFLAHLHKVVRSTCDLPLGEKLNAIRRREIRPWMLLADFSYDRMKRNRTLANSDWTQRRIEREYGIASITVHPPAAGAFPDTPWEQREESFVMAGRFTPAKRPDWVIRILSRVRERFPQVRMHLIGTTSMYPGDRGYFESLQPQLKEHAAWVTLHVDVPRESLVNLMARQRFGIHAVEDEHFGMSVAEMVVAGCIPFVHNSGGPPDTVCGDERILFTSFEDAIGKISRVLASASDQQDIRNRLTSHKDCYRPDSFMSAIRREVRNALSELRW